MANKLLFKRGTETNRSGITPDSGEPLWVTDTNKLYIGDGVTAGGIEIAPTDVDDTPVNGATTSAISSNWAYDLLNSDNTWSGHQTIDRPSIGMMTFSRGGNPMWTVNVRDTGGTQEIQFFDEIAASDAAIIEPNSATGLNDIKSLATRERGDTRWLQIANIDDTPVNGETSAPISSNWAFDIQNGTNAFTLLNVDNTVKHNNNSIYNTSQTYTGGIKLGTDNVRPLLLPVDNTGANLDATADIGVGTVRWRDAHFSGTVYATGIDSSGAIDGTNITGTNLTIDGIMVVNAQNIYNKSAAGKVGLRFETGALLPLDDTAALTNNSCDIGSATNAFGEGHFGGTVNAVALQINSRVNISANDLYDSTSLCGLTFSSGPAISPCDGAGASINNAVDIGTTGFRWRHGYFGGTVNAAAFVATGDATIGGVFIDASEGIYFESLKHAITWNDGTGNFNIRVGHTDQSSVEKCTEAGYAMKQEWTQSSGLWEVQVSNASLAVNDTITWRAQITANPAIVTLGYQGSTKLQTAASGIALTGGITEDTYTLTGTAINMANGTIQTKTLSANTTFTESLSDGDSVYLRLVNAATYTVTWPTITWTNGDTPPSLTNSCAVVLWQENSVVYGTYVGSFV